jgi:hypothetical protein
MAHALLRKSSFQLSRQPAPLTERGVGPAGGTKVNRYLNRARPLAAFLAIALGSTVAAPPAAVAAPAPAPARPLAAAAEAAGAALPQSAVAQVPTTAPAATAPAVSESKPFFKTTKGVVALVLTAGALGYMGYSFSNDRVSSPQR